MKSGNYCPVKKFHAECAEFAEAHTLCLCLPSGRWRKCSVRLCVFLTYNNIPIPHGFRDFRVFCVKKKLSPADHEDLRVSFIKV